MPAPTTFPALPGSQPNCLMCHLAHGDCLSVCVCDAPFLTRLTTGGAEATEAPVDTCHLYNLWITKFRDHGDGPIFVHGVSRRDRGTLGAMQHYLALTAAELLAQTPPGRPPLYVQSADVPDGSSWDETSEDCRDDAAVLSLEMSREEGMPATRLVISGSLASADSVFTTWDQVDEIYADDNPGRELCAKLFATATQEDADAVMEQLFDEELMWFDISERVELGHALLGTEAVDEV